MLQIRYIHPNTDFGFCISVYMGPKSSNQWHIKSRKQCMTCKIKASMIDSMTCKIEVEVNDSKTVEIYDV